MDEEEKRAGAGTPVPVPDKRIVYAVIAVAVVILAVVLVARFGYNVDLLNPSFGEMAIAKPRVAVAPVKTLSHEPPPDIAPITTTPTPEGCILGGWTPGIRCSGVCINALFDPNNCGGCDKKCAAGQLCYNAQCRTPDLMNDPYNCGRLYNKCPTPPNTVMATCYQGTCTFSECLPRHRFCGDYTEGCVPMFNDEDHCGSCGMKCSSDQWCNITHCESGSKPGNCGYINCKGLVCSYKDDGTPECVPPQNPAPCGGSMSCPAGHCKWNQWGVPYCAN